MRLQTRIFLLGGLLLAALVAVILKPGSGPKYNGRPLRTGFIQNAVQDADPSVRESAAQRLRAKPPAR